MKDIRRFLLTGIVFVLAAGDARAIDFDETIDARILLAQARAAASEADVVSADQGDGYSVKGGLILRVRDKYQGKVFGPRLGILENAFDVADIVSYQDRLVALQKNGRLWVFCPLNALSGAWAVIGVGAARVTAADGRLYITDAQGRRFVHAGDLAEETSFGLKSSLVNGWLLPSVVFGNLVHSFQAVP